MDFKIPDLSHFSATDREMAIASQYTRITQDDHEVQPWLVVGNQSLRIGGGEETTLSAAWACWMLAKAIQKIEDEAIHGHVEGCLA